MNKMNVLNLSTRSQIYSLLSQSRCSIAAWFIYQTKPCSQNGNLKRKAGLAWFCSTESGKRYLIAAPSHRTWKHRSKWKLRLLLRESTSVATGRKVKSSCNEIHSGELNKTGDITDPPKKSCQRLVDCSEHKIDPNLKSSPFRIDTNPCIDTTQVFSSCLFYQWGCGAKPIHGSYAKIA